jgi:invasion protein IalB
MALSVAQARIVGRIGHVGAAAIALAIGTASLTGNGAAQQGPAKKGAPASAAGPNNPWVKLCGKTPIGVMYKDGKEEARLGDFCLTQYERLDENTGALLVSVAVRKSDAEDKPYFVVTVPLGMRLQAGVRATLYPGGLWEQAQKNERVDETKLKGLNLDYKMCSAAGCVAELEATPEIFNDLKTFKGLAVFAINAEAKAAAFPVPLTGFEQAFAGNPVDAKQYIEARKALLQKIAQRQREQAEQQQKQQPSWQATPAPAPKK